MRVFIFNKMNMLEYTALALIQALFINAEDLEVIPVMLEQYIEHDNMVSKLDMLIKHSAPKKVGDRNIILLLNSYTTTALEKMLNKLPQDNYKIILEGQKYPKSRLTNIKVVQYNETDYLTKVIDTLCSVEQLKSKIDMLGLENIRLFADRFSQQSCGQFLSELFIKEKYGQVEKSFLDIRECIPRLEHIKRKIAFNYDVDNLLGVKLGLYINYKALDKYYNWLTYKFHELKLQHRKNFTTTFFTEGELMFMYKSLDSRTEAIRKSLEQLNAQQIDRNSEFGEKIDTVFVLHTEKASKTLNEIILRLYYNQVDGDLIICSIGNKFAIRTMFTEASQEILGNKNVDLINEALVTHSIVIDNKIISKSDSLEDILREI